MSKTDKPIGLLIGMVFIIAFGLILSQVTGTRSLPPAPVAAEENLEAYAPSVVEDCTPIGLPARPREMVASVTPPGGDPGRPGPAAVIESVLAPPAGKPDKGGTVEMEMHPGATELAAMGAALRNTLMGIGPGVGNVVKPPPTGGVAPVPGPSGLDPIPAPPPTPKVTIYKVEAGDTLIKIARKVYGPDNWRLYKQIFETNRKAMDDDETALTVGMELTLPVRPADKAGATVPAPGAGAAGGAAGAIADASGGAGRVTEMGLGELGKRFGTGTGTDATAGRGHRVYVVQRGDNLKNIARKVLNDDSAAAVKKIYNANKDRLPAPNRLSVGMQLQIPS